MLSLGVQVPVWFFYQHAFRRVSNLAAVSDGINLTCIYNFIILTQ
jgi:hypothetical protein